MRADWDVVEDLKAQVFADGKIQSEAALVELQNATDEAGFADEFAGFLRRHGVAAEDILLGDAVPVYSSSLIVDRAGKDYTARKLAEWLGLPPERVITTADPRAGDFSEATGDIVVVLASDARPATAVAPFGN